MPVAALLAHHFDLNGITHLPRWRGSLEAVPTGHFEVADISEADYDAASYDGIVAFCSLVHLPREGRSLSSLEFSIG